ncbi:MAG: hypothetical protein ACI9KM_000551 [Rubritalea sp.]|jgi:hypothetical protein
MVADLSPDCLRWLKLNQRKTKASYLIGRVWHRIFTLLYEFK